MGRPILSSPTSPAPDPARSWRERTLARLIGQVRALLPVGAVTFIEVDEEHGSVRRSAGWFASDDLRDALEPSASGRLDRSRRDLVEAVLGRKRPLLLPRVDAWEAAPALFEAAVESLGRECAEQLWRAYSPASVIACAVRSEVGHALGVLVTASLEPERPLGAEHVRTVEVMADLAAMTLDRASLLEAEGRRAREELRLKRAAEDVSGTLELHEVYDRVVRQAAAVTGGTRALLSRLNPRTGELRSEAHVDFSDELTRQALALGSGSFGHVARTRAPVIAKRTDAEGLDLGLMESERIGSLMHAPIELGPRLYGVLTVAHEDSGRFGAHDLELLVRLARSSAAAIANAIDFGRERRIARALTAGFVPESLPAIPGYETGLLYEPSANEPTGGDVYGAWPVAGGHEIAVLVGDVAGKGVETAALSAMARFFIEARTYDSPSPARVLEQANAMLCDRLPSDTFVTAFLGILASDSLRYCNAGHLPPLHVSAAGASELEGHGLPLGIDTMHGYPESVLALEPGDLVVAYSDGLLEARRAGEIYGSERLGRLVRDLARTLTPQDLVRALHDEVGGWSDGLADDMVALALRRSR